MAKKEKDYEYTNTWMPSLKWLLRVLAIIYIFIIIAFFAFNYLLKPYMRDIPKEITPWITAEEQSRL